MQISLQRESRMMSSLKSYKHYATLRLVAIAFLLLLVASWLTACDKQRVVFYCPIEKVPEQHLDVLPEFNDYADLAEEYGNRVSELKQCRADTRDINRKIDIVNKEYEKKKGR